MGDLQTKPLVPEWVKKLAEAIDQEYLITFQFDNQELTLDDLAEFMWTEIVKGVIPDIKDPSKTPS